LFDVAPHLVLVDVGVRTVGVRIDAVAMCRIGNEATWLAARGNAAAREREAGTVTPVDSDAWKPFAFGSDWRCGPKGSGSPRPGRGFSNDGGSGLADRR
jgi:hypothetical protein